MHTHTHTNTHTHTPRQEQGQTEAWSPDLNLKPDAGDPSGNQILDQLHILMVAVLFNSFKNSM